MLSATACRQCCCQAYILLLTFGCLLYVQKRHLDDPEVLNTISGGLAGEPTSRICNIAPIVVLGCLIRQPPLAPAWTGLWGPPAGTWPPPVQLASKLHAACWRHAMVFRGTREHAGQLLLHACVQQQGPITALSPCRCPDDHLCAACLL